MVKFTRSTEQILLWKDELLEKENFKVVLGKSKNEKLIVNLNGFQHILIGGVAGSGKTELVKTIAWQASRKEANVFIINTCGIEILNKKMKSKIKVLENDLLVLNLFRQLRKESVERLELMKSNKGNVCKLPKILIFIDDISHYLSSIKDKNGNYKFDLQEKIILELKKLLIETKNTGIHFVLSSTNLYRDIIGEDILDLVKLRIVGTVYDLSVLKRIFTEVDQGHVSTCMDNGTFITLIDNTIFKFKSYIIK